MLWFVMKSHEPIGRERYRSICLAIVVTELDLVYSGRKVSNHGTHLTTQEPFLRNLLYQRHNGQHLEFNHHTSHSDRT